MKITRREKPKNKVRDIGTGVPFCIPGGVYGLPPTVTYIRVEWGPNIKTDRATKLVDRDIYRTGHGLNEWQSDRYACVNLANGRMYLIGGDCGVEAYLNAEVVIR